MSPDTNDQQLREAFECFGKVGIARVVREQGSGQSKGFGYVEMGSVDEAWKAIQHLNGSPLQGHTLYVKETRSRPGQ